MKGTHISLPNTNVTFILISHLYIRVFMNTRYNVAYTTLEHPIVRQHFSNFICLLRCNALSSRSENNSGTPFSHAVFHLEFLKNQLVCYTLLSLLTVKFGNRFWRDNSSLRKSERIPRTLRPVMTVLISYAFENIQRQGDHSRNFYEVRTGCRLICRNQ